MFSFFERLVPPTAKDVPGSPPAGILNFYWFFSRQILPYLALLVLMGAAHAGIDAAIPVFIGQLVHVLVDTPRDRLLAEGWPTFVAMAAALIILRPIIVAGQSLVQFQVIFPGMTNMVRWQGHRHVIRQSLAYFQSDFAGRIASRVMETGFALRASIVSVISVCFYMLALVSSGFILIGRTDMLLCIPLGAWCVAYVVFLVWLVPRVSKASTTLSYARSGVTGRIVDSYTNILTVKLFANVKQEDDHVRASLDHHTASMHAQMRLFTILTIVMALLSGVLIVSTGALAIWLWQTGQIGIDVVAMALPLTLQISTTAKGVAFETTAMFEQFGTVHEGMDTLARPLTVTDKPQAAPVVVRQGAVTFDRVTFHYGREGGVIDAFSLAIAPGEKIGLVGRSGAGKSTLVNLLLRFHDLEGGRILIDGQDIAQATQDSVRRQIAVVTQDTSLLHRSIRENIRYGRPDATDAEIEAAARQAHAHDFIMGLEDWNGRTGYDAQVGERGVKLSGGQRQRIAIARVILKNAPILILDEATSALDSEVEAAIQEQLETLMAGKTVISIAHRLSTIARMDRLVILDHGRIVEQGTHQELLALDGHYAALWHRQSGGFLEADEDAGEPQALAG